MNAFTKSFLSLTLCAFAGVSFAQGAVQDTPKEKAAPTKHVAKTAKSATDSKASVATGTALSAPSK